MANSWHCSRQPFVTCLIFSAKLELERFFYLHVYTAIYAKYFLSCMAYCVLLPSQRSQSLALNGMQELIFSSVDFVDLSLWRDKRRFTLEPVSISLHLYSHVRFHCAQ
ncbi:hypothetical protein Tcan_09981 [Toxocara canis]|uniref:Uncharacterized protein n=1 Tax=Toxocara canis TaxID=6265 RepID=A0A0B2UW85_TOXCA|nr:hypothetical protein Tcan_09981 [Toxocara canis]